MFINTFLIQIFTCFSTLGLLSSMSLTWEDILRSNLMVSLAEFMVFAETFEITPSIVPRHILSNKIFPSCSQKISEEPALTFTRFLESICKIALYIYNRYRTELKSPALQIQELFDTIGFNDKKRYIAQMKKAGVGAHNKVLPKKTVTKPALVEDVSEAALQNKEQLKDQLQRIFMYYCSFGDRLNMGLMSASKYSKFIRDIKIAQMVKTEETDLIFVKLMKSKITKNVVAGIDDKQQRMSFPYFVESIKIVATKVFPKLHPTKALIKLLSHHILPNAKKMPEKFTNVDVKDPASQEVMLQHKKVTFGVSN